MATTLRLRIHTELDLGEKNLQDPPQVYAKIYKLVPSAGQLKRVRPPREELVPVSGRPKDWTTINLDPGHYFVEAVLPSGEILADDVKLETGRESELTLEGERSPHEWLSWQHLMGDAQTVSTVDRSFSRLRVLRGSQSTQLLSTPHSALVAAAPEAAQAWSLIGETNEDSLPALIGAMNKNKNGIGLSAYMQDAERVVFRVNVDGLQGSGHHNLNKLSTAASRYYIVVSRQHSVELLSLPLPWREIKSHRPVDVEITVQAPGDPREFYTSIGVLDESLGMLIGYLASGAFPSARKLCDAAKDSLFLKTSNPLAAAAGGYALVSTDTDPSDKDWHAWIRNLYQFFPHIPDGAIQWGQHCLRRRRTAKDVEEARKAFKSAFQRGLPFYSLGIRWLLEGLESTSRDDPEGAKMIEAVRRVAWNTCFAQAFTIIRVGSE